MGLTRSSVSKYAGNQGTYKAQQLENSRVVALAGNPNVGKSTIFNALTGMNQHTGNWPGKTVSSAQGYCRYGTDSYLFVDLPGTYSLHSHSAEEEIARNFICFHSPDAVVVVCDATCLERNLNLVLQILEITDRVIVCINLLDEAKRKHILIDLEKLSKQLGVPVIGTCARKKQSLNTLLSAIPEASKRTQKKSGAYIPVSYQTVIEECLTMLTPILSSKAGKYISPRFLALKLLENDMDFQKEYSEAVQQELFSDPAVKTAVTQAWQHLEENQIDSIRLKDMIVSSLVKTAESLAFSSVSSKNSSYRTKDIKIDRILTSRLTGYPIMLLLLALLLWLTIFGANYPSRLLSDALFFIQEQLLTLFTMLGAPKWLQSMLVLGVYRTLAWVVSVMLPPMAIFFPLFTLLEDAGYLPRIAFNLDKPFQCCHACGKQALTMCMGLGCNAAGIIGCRIIDSKREQLIAILTNNFIPCNGRYPTLIAILTMFFVGFSGSFSSSLLSAAFLTAFIVLGVIMTFLVSFLLSKTLLKGAPSAYTLELPPYRRPQAGQVIIRSIFDRTLFVLGRAVSVAAPAGLLLWLMANVTCSGVSLLNHCSNFLDPFARFFGLDGVILMAFLLGFPANEIVVPILIMAYLSKGTLVEFESLARLKELLIQNGWTGTTALCTMLFCLMHWPCSTALLTIKKETGSIKWTLLAFLIPTLCGLTLCFLASHIAAYFL